MTTRTETYPADETAAEIESEGNDAPMLHEACGKVHPPGLNDFCTATLPDDTDLPAEISAEEARDAIFAAADAAPVDYSAPMRLGDFGDDLKDIGPAWIKLTGKATTLRILHRMPVPEDQKPGNTPPDKIAIYARFKVAIHPTGEERAWDVSSKKLLAKLQAVPNLRDWFNVTKEGKGSATTYEVIPGVAAKGGR